MITASLFTALDGVVDPMVGNWHFPYFNDEMGDAVSGTHDTDVMLFGRVTYDSFTGAWPEREAAVARMRNSPNGWATCARSWRPTARWCSRGGTRSSCRATSARPVAALKNDSSIRRIGLSGSVSVVRQLLDAGLLDELHLFVHPATAGSGLRLFDDGAPPRHLKLVSVTPFETGVYLVYAPDPNPPTGTYAEVKQSLPQE